MNSPWNRPFRAALLVALTVAPLACKSEERKQADARAEVQAEQHTPQGSADMLGRELSEIMDRVMAYRSSHRNQLPNSLRQAGLDSLTSLFIRHYSRQGNTPSVTIRFRNTSDRAVASCTGTNQVLEDAVLHDGRFDVSCEMTAGGSQNFTIEPPAPPKQDQ